DSDIHQLIEECSIKVCEEQKQNMEDTMLELVKICQQKEFLCIHDDVDDLNESALNSKLLLINSNSQRLDKKEQKVKNVVEQRAERGNLSIQSLQNFRIVHKSSISFDTSQISSIHSIAPIISTNEPEHLLSMGYEHLSITPETKSDEVIESNAENLLPILSKCEVTLEDKRECDVPISENSPVCDNHSDIFSDSKIDDDILVYDDDFENIEYVEASLSDPEIVSIEEENGVEKENVKIVSIEEENGVEEENVVQQEEEEVDFEDISQIQDVVLREKLLSITRLISNIESLNDNSTSDQVKTAGTKKLMLLVEVKTVSTNTNGVVNAAQAVNTANKVSTASTQVNVVNNLSDAVICAFMAIQPNSTQLAHENLEQIHSDDMEEMDLRWQMAMLTIRAKRECRAPRNQDFKHKESTRRSVPVETLASIALVSCDGFGGYDWRDKAKEGPNYALIAYTSSTSDPKIVNNCKKGLGYENYNAVPPPYIGNFMPPKPDLCFTKLDEFANKPVAENTKSSNEETKAVKKNNDAL
nr:hypothetical protein [Tanacetum cinerariifolium]